MPDLTDYTDNEIAAENGRRYKIQRARVERENEARRLAYEEKITQRLRGDIAIALGLPGITDAQLDGILAAVREYNESTWDLYQATANFWRKHATASARGPGRGPGHRHGPARPWDRDGTPRRGPQGAVGSPRAAHGRRSRRNGGGSPWVGPP